MDAALIMLDAFLDGKAPQLPGPEFKAYALALFMIYRVEGPVTDTHMARLLTAKGWAAQSEKLIEKGFLYRTAVGGYMNRRALAVLNDYLQDRQASRINGKNGGLKGSMIKRQKEADEARRLLAVTDLFASPSPGANDDHMQTMLTPSAYGMNIVGQHPPEKPNEINKTPQAPLDAIDTDTDREEEPLCVPPFDDGSETNEDDGFSIPKRRKPSTPVPANWHPPTLDQLTPHVRTRVDQWPDGTFDREREKFMADATAEDRRHRDWGMAFGKWCLVHDGYLQNRKGGNYGKPAGFIVPNLGG